MEREVFLRKAPLDEAMLLVEEGAGLDHAGPGVGAEVVIGDREALAIVDGILDRIVSILICDEVAAIDHDHIVQPHGYVVPLIAGRKAEGEQVCVLDSVHLMEVA